MKKLILIASLVFGAGQMAAADLYSDYADLGKKIVADAQSGATHETVAEQMFVLTDLGFQQMDLFAAKHPECSEQFAIMSYADLDARYHDGVGLPETPRICYMGRSMVAHPYMSLALHRDGLQPEEEGAFYHEMEEVIERADWMREHLQ